VMGRFGASRFKVLKDRQELAEVAEEEDLTRQITF